MSDLAKDPAITSIPENDDNDIFHHQFVLPALNPEPSNASKPHLPPSPPLPPSSPLSTSPFLPPSPPLPPTTPLPSSPALPPTASQYQRGPADDIDSTPPRPYTPPYLQRPLMYSSRGMDIFVEGIELPTFDFPGRGVLLPRAPSPPRSVIPADLQRRFEAARRQAQIGQDSDGPAHDALQSGINQRSAHGQESAVTVRDAGGLSAGPRNRDGSGGDPVPGRGITGVAKHARYQAPALNASPASQRTVIWAPQRAVTLVGTSTVEHPAPSTTETITPSSTAETFLPRFPTEDELIFPAVWTNYSLVRRDPPRDGLPAIPSPASTKLAQPATSCSGEAVRGQHQDRSVPGPPFPSHVSELSPRAVPTLKHKTGSPALRQGQEVGEQQTSAGTQASAASSEEHLPTVSFSEDATAAHSTSGAPLPETSNNNDRARPDSQVMPLEPTIERSAPQSAQPFPRIWIPSNSTTPSPPHPFSTIPLRPIIPRPHTHPVSALPLSATTSTTTSNPLTILSLNSKHWLLILLTLLFALLVLVAALIVLMAEKPGALSVELRRGFLIGVCVVAVLGVGCIGVLMKLRWVVERRQGANRGRGRGAGHRSGR